MTQTRTHTIPIHTHIGPKRNNKAQKEPLFHASFSLHQSLASQHRARQAHPPHRMAARASTVARTATQGLFKQVLEDIRAAGTWKAERIITSPQAASIAVSTSKTKAISDLGMK